MLRLIGWAISKLWRGTGGRSRSVLALLTAIFAVFALGGGTAGAVTLAHSATKARFPLLARNSFARVSGDRLLVQAAVVNDGTARVGATEGSVAWRSSAALGLVSVRTFRLPALAKGATKQLSFTAKPPVGTKSGRYTVFVCLDIAGSIQKFQASTNCMSVETVAVQSAAGPKSGPAPKTTITAAPARWTAHRTARFSFKASIAKSSFDCSFDGGVWVPCRPGIQYTRLSPGSHGFQVRAVSPTGAVDASPARASWTLDTVAPVVTLTSPAPGALLTETAVTYAGRAGTAAGDLAPVRIRLYNGAFAVGAPLATVTAKASKGNWSFQTTALQPGQYTVQVSQADQAGNRRTTPPVTFAVDPPPSAPVAPTVTLAAPANGTYSNVTQPTFSGDAGTSLTDSAVAVNIYPGGTASGTPVQSVAAVVGSGGVWTVQASSPLHDGTYTAQAFQTNGAASGSSTTATFTVDTVAPVVSVTSPDSGQELNSTNLEISGRAGTLTGDLPPVTVTLSSAAGTQTLIATANSGSWSVGTGTLGDGTYTVQATQADQAGNAGQSTPVTFVVNHAAPTVTLASPADGSYSKQTKPTFSGTAGTDPNYSSVTVDINDITSATSLPSLSATVQANGTWTIQQPSTLPQGTYTARASQTNGPDAVGTSATVTFTIDTTAPAVSITSPTAGEETNNTSPTITGTAGTATGDQAPITVDLYQGTTPTGTPTPLQTTALGGAWSVPITGTLGDGNYTIVASQADLAGNTGDSTAVTFRVNAAAPTVTLTSPASGSYSSDTEPTFTGQAGTDSLYSGVTLNIYAGSTASGSPLRSIPATGSGGSWTAGVPNSSPLADGPYTAQATQSNGSASAVSGQVQFTVDTIAPTPVIMSPTAEIDVNAPTISGTAGSATGDQDSITVKLYSGSSATGSPLQTLSATASGGSWSTPPTSTLADGTYTVVAYQTDLALNTGASDPVTFTVDTTPPTVGIIDPTDSELTTNSTPTISGTASTDPGDLQTISVNVFLGSSATGTPVQTLIATATDGTWTTPPTNPLADGTYTVQAVQHDQSGNTGSTAVTFSIDASG